MWQPPSLWNALPQHLILASMNAAAFKVKVMNFLKERFVQRCELRVLEQRYINVTIIIMIIRYDDQ